MLRSATRHFRLILPMLAIFAAVPQATAQEELTGHQRTQEIALHKGWNAVFLEVEPLEAAPATVFAGLPVDKAATLFQSPATNQFVTDPSVDLFKAQGWGVWYAPGLPEAFLKSLDAINGNRAYLIHAKSDCQWRATGRVTGATVKWQPDAFNFVGFSVRAVGGPTFQQFFAGSKAHHGQAIYRMVNGRWKQVLQPSSEVMHSGEAFWIHCKGPSEFQGPLKVEATSRQALTLGQGPTELILRNESPHPLSPTMAHVAGDAAPLPLSILIRTYGDPAAPVKPVAARMPAGAWEQDLPPLEIGGAIAIPFECRSAELLRPRQGSLLKITTDLGTETWLPVTGTRDDLGN